MVPLKFTPDRPPYCYGNQVAFLNCKLAVARLCKNVAQNLVPNTFFIIVTTCHNHFGMVTKFWDSTSKSNCKIINKTANIIYKKTVTILFKVV